VDDVLKLTALYADEYSTWFWVYSSSHWWVEFGRSRAVSTRRGPFGLVAKFPTSGSRTFGLWRAFPAGHVLVRVRLAGVSALVVRLLGAAVTRESSARGLSRGLHGAGEVTAVTREEGKRRIASATQEFCEYVTVYVKSRAASTTVGVQAVVKGRLPQGRFLRNALVQQKRHLWVDLPGTWSTAEGTIDFDFASIGPHVEDVERGVLVSSVILRM